MPPPHRQPPTQLQMQSMPDASSMPPDVYAAALEHQQQQQRQQPQHSQAANSQQYNPPPVMSSQQQQTPGQQSGTFMQTPNQGMSVTPMNPQGYLQLPLSAEQHFAGTPGDPWGLLGTAASTAPSTEAEPPVPGTEDAAAAKAPVKAAAKPSYSAAPVLRAAATPAAEGTPQQVCFFTLCPITAHSSTMLPMLLKLLVMNH